MTDKLESAARSVDSLSAYEFQVELNGQIVGGVFNVHGLTSFILAEDMPPVVIAKMVQRDPGLPFNRWIRETLAGGRPTRDLAIVAMDEGYETRRWVYRDAFISRISYSDFDTGLTELVEERVEIRADRVEEIWP